jgi:gluconolactonase
VTWLLLALATCSESPSTVTPESDAFLCPPGPFGNPLTPGSTPERIPAVPPADGFVLGSGIVEGPVWVDGALYVSHFANSRSLPASRILRVMPDGSVSVFIEDGGANGLAITRGGDLLAARHTDGTISRLSKTNPTTATAVAGGYGGIRFNTPNDLAVRSDGNIYLSDPDWQNSDRPQGQTRVYRISPSGMVSVVDEDIEQPNGITLSPDENTLYVSALGTLYRYDVAADGTVSGRGVFSPGVAGGDGMVVDCAGNLYVTSGTDVVVVAPSGAVLGSIAVDGVEQVTNVAFGGPARTTLYITNLGVTQGLHKIELNVPGFPY